jgi:pimeloyl-ACP methyl ester carboxylesterase
MGHGYTDLLKLDLRDTLSEIKCETLIIGASFPYKEVAQENFEKQYEKLPNKVIKMASNSKHFIMYDQPEWFYNTLNNFLANERK